MVVLSEWLTTKLIASGAATIAAMVISVFWQPQELEEKGKTAAACITGGVASTLGVLFTGVIAKALGFDVNNPDDVLAVAGIIGLCSLLFIKIATNFFKSQEKKTILEVAKGVKNAL